ncbi:MAG: PAS domain S-box protein [Anaerolineales bacterium]
MVLGQVPHEASDRLGGFIKRLKRDPLLLATLGTVVCLTILVMGMKASWWVGPALGELPWYIPLISAFIVLISICISYLSFGRYQVLRDALSFWVGSGFALYAIGQIFFALTWPSVLPTGAAILARLPGTSAWIGQLNLIILDIFLLAAVLVRWPDAKSLMEKRWIWFVVGTALEVISIFGLLIHFESSLPVMVTDQGVFTTPLRLFVSIQIGMFALGGVLSARRYYRTSDKLAVLISFPQIALTFISMMALIGGKRYDFWWYVQQLIQVAALLAVLFGLLREYVRLLQRESEGVRLLEAILENVPIGLTITGGPPDFPVTRVNRQGLEMSQRSLSDLIGVPSGRHQVVWRIFLPDGVTMPEAEQMPLFRASRMGEESRNVEFVMEAQDGHQVPVLANAAPIYDAQGNIMAAVSTWLDITDRKRVEKILQDSEALYRAIAQNIPSGGVFVVDRDFRYLIAEGQVMKDFGYSREMLEGHMISEVFSAETVSKMKARFQRVLEGETISYETENNGRIYWTQNALMEGSLGHIIIITMDVTDRRLTEKALNESEQRFRAIVSQATAGIIRSTVGGELIFVNQALCDMLGFMEDELIGMTIWQLTHINEYEENKRLFDRMMERGIPFQMENRFIRRDGANLWVNVSASPILDSTGKPQSAVSVVVDITDRKEAEEQLQQLNLQLENRVRQRTVELQSANVALMESRRRLQILSQRMVEVQEDERRALARELHDRVGQTLTALNLNLTIIGNQVNDQLAPTVSSRLGDSIKLVTEMIDIVRDVMSDLRPVVLDEYGLVAALQAYLARFESRYAMHVEFGGSEHTLPRLGDAMEMTVLRIAQEALLNIARHAQAKKVSVSLRLEKECIFLTVTDDGIGMQEEYATGRSGMHGLMIMRERAEAVGGTLKISSTPEKGTTIEASLPVGSNAKIGSEKDKE